MLNKMAFTDFEKDHGWLKLWPFVLPMTMGKTFLSCLEVLLTRTTSLEYPKNYTILTAILQ